MACLPAAIYSRLLVLAKARGEIKSPKESVLGADNGSQSFANLSLTRRPIRFARARRSHYLPRPPSECILTCTTGTPSVSLLPPAPVPPLLSAEMETQPAPRSSPLSRSATPGASSTRPPAAATRPRRRSISAYGPSGPRRRQRTGLPPKRSASSLKNSRRNWGFDGLSAGNLHSL